MSGWPVRRRLGAFALALGAAFGVGVGLGALGSPIEADRPTGHDEGPHSPGTTSTTESPYADDHDHFGGGG